MKYAVYYALNAAEMAVMLSFWNRNVEKDFLIFVLNLKRFDSLCVIKYLLSPFKKELFNSIDSPASGHWMKW